MPKWVALPLKTYVYTRSAHFYGRNVGVCFYNNSLPIWNDWHVADVIRWESHTSSSKTLLTSLSCDIPSILSLHSFFFLSATASTASTPRNDDQDVDWYLNKRPGGGLCLAFVRLTIQVVDLVRGHSRLSDEGIKNRVVPDRSKVPRGAGIFMKYLTLNKEQHPLQVTFWCKSGTKFSPPSTFERNCAEMKNCAEIAVLEISRRVLEEVKHQGYTIVQTDIKCMTDLSPCPDCTRNIPGLRMNLRHEFSDIQFTYKQTSVLQYEEYSVKSKEEKKSLKMQEYLRRKRENV